MHMRTAVFVGGLTASIAIAVAGLAAQDRPERRAEATGRHIVMLDGRGSRLGVIVRDLAAGEGNGVRVDEVSKDSPAEKAGLRAGDIVVEYDGERVRSARQFTRLVEESAEGRSVALAVTRDGQRQALQVTPAARALPFDVDIDGDRIRREVERSLEGLRDFKMDGPPLRFRYDNDLPMRMPGRARLGVSLQSLSPQLAEYFGVRDGALVSSVSKDSPAEKAGLKAGDVITSVNGAAVRDAEDVSREMARGSGADVTLGIVRDRKTQSLKATVEPTRTPRLTAPAAGSPVKRAA
jgi:serine protease Do